MPTPQATLRPALPADAGAIGECVAEAYRHYIPRIGKPPGPMGDDYTEVVRHHRVFVAEAEAGESGIIGVLVLMQTKTGMLLDNIAVHPEHQRKGIGRQLLQLAESKTRDLGHSHLQLYTHERMTENIALYKHAGYTETTRRTEQGYDRVYMQKALQKQR